MSKLIQQLLKIALNGKGNSYSKKKILIIVLLLVGLVVYKTFENREPFSQQEITDSSEKDSRLNDAFTNRLSNLEITDYGTLTKILPDDVSGSKHQRFIIRIKSGQTILIAHNIDIAPRVKNLEIGDTIEVKGVYEWNEQGGVIHWTHHDPKGYHAPGWIRYNGEKYQ